VEGLEKINIADYLEYHKEWVLIDVRTPAEFAQGHIIGANNIPLFSNDERAIVGTIYKKQSPEKALLKGLELVGKKLPFFIKKAKKLAPHKNVVLYCWRGGKRSGSVSWLLSFAGFNVKILSGGYKAYRTFLFDCFNQPLQIQVVGGKTGTGKTEILHHLKNLEAQVIDLEGLAHHKGSAFGALGEEAQPSVEQFENLLFNSLYELDKSKPIWVENESRSIGRVFIPQGFWDSMKKGCLHNIEIPHNERLTRTVKDYQKFPKEALIEVFKTIEKKLGGQHCLAAISALQKNDYRKAAEIALVYYDKTYQYGLEQNPTAEKNFFQFNHADMQIIAKALLEFKL
jgi:tRNA 2-selenouridine synthase